MPVLLCALTAHAVAYRSFIPGDPVHGYLGFYEAAVAVVSTLALAVVLLAAVLAALGRSAGLARVLAPRVDPTPTGYRVAAIALWAYGLLVLQETAEAIVGATQGERLAFGFGSWLVAVLALAVASAVVVFVSRSYRRVVGALLGLTEAGLPRAPASLPRPSHPAAPCRRKALADFRALRAPPVFA